MSVLVRPPKQKVAYKEWVDLLAEPSDSIKQRAQQVLQHLPPPHPKYEEWRQTPIWNYLKEPLQLAEPESIKPGDEHIAFINGYPEVAAQWPENVDVSVYTRFDDIPEHLREKLHGLVNDSEYFAMANLAYSPAVVIVEAKGKVNEPLKIKHYLTQNAASFPRLLVIVHDDSELAIDEVWETKEGYKFSVFVGEAYVGKNSILWWSKEQHGSDGVVVVDYTEGALYEGARASVFTYTSGAGFWRNMPHLRMRGPNSGGYMYGITIAGENALFDNHTFMEHVSPDTEGDEYYKGLVDGGARVVFNGRIYVHQQAQGTNSYQSDRYIELKDNAYIFSRPQLEIFADDVKCTHGAAIGFVDTNALLYMKMRGIREEKAKYLIYKGFLGEIIEKCPNFVKDRWQEQVENDLQWVLNS